MPKGKYARKKHWSFGKHAKRTARKIGKRNKGRSYPHVEKIGVKDFIRGIMVCQYALDRAKTLIETKGLKDVQSLKYVACIFTLQENLSKYYYELLREGHDKMRTGTKTMSILKAKRENETIDEAAKRLGIDEKTKEEFKKRPGRRKGCKLSDGREFATGRGAVQILAAEGKLQMPKYNHWSAFSILKQNKIKYTRV